MNLIQNLLIWIDKIVGLICIFIEFGDKTMLYKTECCKKYINTLKNVQLTLF